MPGSRCVTRAQAVELEAAEAAGQAALKEAKAKGASSKETKKSSVTNMREEEAIPKRYNFTLRFWLMCNTITIL